MIGVLPERIRVKIDMADDCWLWTAAKDRHGYGRVRWEGLSSAMAHRVVYELLVGPIPGGLTLDHLCRTPSCVKPAHLEPVTLRENILRGDSPSARHAQKTHCPHGHEYDYIDPRGARQCRRCRMEAWRRHHARKAA